MWPDRVSNPGPRLMSRMPYRLRYAARHVYMYQGVAYFMLPKYICAALLGHTHVCAYERIALSFIRSLNRAHPNRLRKKVYMPTACRSSQHPQMVCSITTWLYQNIVNLVTGKCLRSLIRFAGLHEHFLFISFIRNWTTLFSTRALEPRTV